MRRVTKLLLGLGMATVCATPALAATGSAGAGASPIQHVVIIYLENHSFDSVLGYWCDKVDTKKIQRAHGCGRTGMPAKVDLSNGATVKPTVDPDKVPSVLHNVEAQIAAMDNGRMDGWQNIPDGSCNTSHNYKCISGYKPYQIPNITGLATNYAVSDETFSMYDSPSWGGHLYAAMASLDGFLGDNPLMGSQGIKNAGWGCDSDRIAKWVSPQGYTEWVPSCVPDYNLGLANGGAYKPTPVKHISTIFDHLDSLGLTWKIYGASHPTDPGYIWAICPSIAQCLDTSQDANLVDASRFTQDAANGKLPAFSIVTPGGVNREVLSSCHNGFSMTACDNWVAKLVSAVHSGPDWPSTAIFMTWDDFGGFYDGVAPPKNPAGAQEGPRVPLIIISPYAKRGYTDTTPTSFAGILAFAEHNFGVTPLNANDKNAYDFSNAFCLPPACTQSPPRMPQLVIRPLPAWTKHVSLTPASEAS